MERRQATLSDVSSDEVSHPSLPLAPQTERKPTLATNRFAMLSSSTVRKGNLLKSPVARDMCKLTERMVVNMVGATSQVSSNIDAEAMDDEAMKKGGKTSKKKQQQAAQQQQQQHTQSVDNDDYEGQVSGNADELFDVSSDDEDTTGPAAATSTAKKSNTNSITVSDNRLMRIEQQFAGGKKAAAKYAAKNCSQKNSDLLMSKSHLELQHKFTHLLVTDFEATCDSAEPDYPHEIIEFPCVAVDLRTMKVVSEFGTFVKPVNNPVLTEFCTTLTTIQQSDVDGAPLIRDVIMMFDEWLAKLRTSYEAHALANYNAAMAAEEREKEAAGASPSEGMGAPSASAVSASTATGSSSPKIKGPIPFNPVFATDGPWDMRKFMHECHVIRDGVAFPEIFYRWVDVRRCFSDFFHKQLFKLTKMLRALGMTFVGERHRGIDDARNIARVAVALAKRGYKFRQTALIPYHAEGSKLLEHERAANALLKEIEEEASKKSKGKKKPAPKQQGKKGKK